MIALWATLAVGAFVQDDAERLRRLEEQVKKQQAEIEELKKGRGEADLDVSFTDGLHFRSHDGAFDIHVGGRFIEEYRHIFSRPDASRTSPNTFFVREAFLQADGTLYRDFGFHVAGDFASSSGGPTASLDEGYFEWKKYPEFTLRFGQYRQPSGQESLTHLLFLDCIERSMLNRFVPNQDLGIMAYGEFNRGLLTYQLSVANGRSQPNAQARSTNDNNDEKEVLLRLTTMPWPDQPDTAMGGLRLGAYGSIADVDDVPMDPQFDLISTELSVTFLDSTTGFLNGRQWRAGAELAYVIGPASLRGEVLLRRDRINDAADTVEESMTTRAWYGQVTMVLFGADKILDTRLSPERPLDLGAGDWGALEAVVRVAGARVGRREFTAVGNSLAGQSNSLLAVTVGLNWVPVKNVRFSGDAIYEDYRDRIDFGNGVHRSALYGLLFRFQIDL